MLSYGLNCRREVLIYRYYYRFMNGKKDVLLYILFMNGFVYFRYYVFEMKYILKFFIFYGF